MEENIWCACKPYGPPHIWEPGEWCGALVEVRPDLLKQIRRGERVLVRGEIARA